MVLDEGREKVFYFYLSVTGVVVKKTRWETKINYFRSQYFATRPKEEYVCGITVFHSQSTVGMLASDYSVQRRIKIK